jgi:hypothetical protein
MTAKEILEELKPLGSNSYKRVIFNHGVKENCRASVSDAGSWGNWRFTETPYK